jgi:hypothetical protein
MARIRSTRGFQAIGIVLAAVVLGGAAGGLLGVCGPFTDVAADSFCPFVLEVFTLGITTGTTATTYDPTSNVGRLQMAAFLSRGVDGVLKRGGRRAALRQFWTIQGTPALGLTTVGTEPQGVESDGADIWVPNYADDTVSRVRGSDGKRLETWTGATFPQTALSAMSRVFVTGNDTPGRLYRIDPSQAAGVVTTVATNLGNLPLGIAFDGARIWTTNSGNPSSVSIVTPGATIPWTVTNVAGFSAPGGILYDGADIWVTEFNTRLLKKLNASGAVLQTVTVGNAPFSPVFDGTNIWVPNVNSASVSVVRASTGAVLATLTGNGMLNPGSAAFDGQRVLITDQNDRVSLWKAADLTAIGFFSTGAGSVPLFACSDGVNFWIALSGSSQVARF